jgi:hypothetical protein
MPCAVMVARLNFFFGVWAESRLIVIHNELLRVQIIKIRITEGKGGKCGRNHGGDLPYQSYRVFAPLAMK